MVAGLAISCWIWVYLSFALLCFFSFPGFCRMRFHVSGLFKVCYGIYPSQCIV